MSQDPSQSKTRDSYILARQLEALEKALADAGESFAGYPAAGASYNLMLDRAQAIFSGEGAFGRSISGLFHCDPALRSGAILSGLGNLKVQVAVLKAAVSSFFDVYSPKEEKAQIGFR